MGVGSECVGEEGEADEGKRDGSSRSLAFPRVCGAL